MGWVSLNLWQREWRYIRSDWITVYKELFHKETIDGTRYRWYVREDDMPVRGSLVVSDEPERDREEEDEVIERLDNGDIWAWAFIECEASRHRVSESSYLGGCTYEDEEHFIACNGDGHMSDMRHRALKNLDRRIDALVESELARRASK